MHKPGKRIPQNYCQGCFLHPQRCICKQIPKIDLKTKITLIIHARELRKTTNTGRLALKALTNSEMRVRGADREVLNLSDLLSPHFRSFLFYPTEDAIELDRQLIESSPLPIQLIVPDGNWAQAGKVHRRHPELKDILRVKITVADSEKLRMRDATKEGGMATLEAIAYALGVIEGDFVKDSLLTLYQIKRQATLQGRGRLKKGITSL